MRTLIIMKAELKTFPIPCLNLSEIVSVSVRMKSDIENLNNSE